MRTERNAKLDICRVVAALFIMAHHTYIFGNREYPFASGWIYVEFFFMITGYFTVRHFMDCKTDISLNEKCHIMLKYVINKFRRLFFYVFVSVTMVYVIEWLYNRPVGKREMLSFFEGWICEALFWGVGGIGQTLQWGSRSVWGYSLAPLWYLSALLVALPIVCMVLLNEKSKTLCIWFSWLLPIAYYTWLGGVHVYRVWPNDILKAFVGLMLGVFVFLICQWVERIQLSVSGKLMVTLLEGTAFILSGVLCYYSADNTFLHLLLLIMLLVCIFSEKGIVQVKSNRVWMFLGNKLSMVMFLTHWVVFKYIQCEYQEWEIGLKICVGFGGTIFLSLFLIWIEPVVSRCIRNVWGIFVRDKKFV